MRRRAKFGLFLGVVVLVLSVLACIPATMPSNLVPILGLELGPETTIVTEPLNELGFPEYQPVVNQIVGEGVQPDENFWARFDEILEVEESGQPYSEALKKLPGFERTSSVPFLSSSRHFKGTPELREEVERASRVLWKQSDSPPLVEWLTKNEAALQVAVDASARPKAYAPLVSLDGDPMLLSTLLPYAQQCRDVIRALTARATLRMSEGRYDDAWQDLVATLRIARHNSSGFSLIERLVGMAILSHGATSTVLAITNEPGTAEVTLNRWKSVAAALNDWPSMDRLSRSERCNLVQMHLMLIAGYDMNWGDNAAGKPTKLLTALLHHAKRRFDQVLIGTFSNVNEGLRYTNTFWDKVDATLKKPTYSEQMQAWQTIEDEYFADVKDPAVRAQVVKSDLRTIAVKMLAPALGQVIVGEARSSQRRLLLHAAFVAEVHFRKTGRDVESGEQLQQFAKEYAAEAGLDCPELVDLFSGEPLRLSKVDGILTIYAVGSNGQDDGGVYDDGLAADDIGIDLVREDELRPPPPPLAIEPVSDDEFGGLDF